MGPMTLEELAQIAYDAYGETTDHKNYQGLPMPQWVHLTDKIREAWIAATKAICEAAGASDVSYGN